MSVIGVQQITSVEQEANPFAGTEGIYLLPHHIKEIERLRTQHRFILSSTDNTLITAPIKEGKLRVLDSGAADGMVAYIFICSNFLTVE